MSGTCCLRMRGSFSWSFSPCCLQVGGWPVSGGFFWCPLRLYSQRASSGSRSPKLTLTIKTNYISRTAGSSSLLSALLSHTRHPGLSHEPVVATCFLLCVWKHVFIPTSHPFPSPEVGDGVPAGLTCVSHASVPITTGVCGGIPDHLPSPYQRSGWLTHVACEFTFLCLRDC